jgi:hypothetical protein
MAPERKLATFGEIPPVQGLEHILFIRLSWPPSKMANMANIPSRPPLTTFAESSLKAMP